jgi:hypothetical protein
MKTLDIERQIRNTKRQNVLAALTHALNVTGDVYQDDWLRSFPDAAAHVKKAYEQLAEARYELEKPLP